MRKVSFRYGSLGLLVIVLLSALSMSILGCDHQYSEAAGYLTILLSMVFVFFGLRHFRNEVNGGYLSFGQGLKVGGLIVLVPAVGFGLFDILYTRVINPSWSANYTAKMTANMDAAQKEAFAKQMALFSNPLFEFALMTATVLIVGVIVTIISTLALMRKPKGEFVV
ncbi:MAG: DUF4199 domain-containing protein [Chitinophagaceae bacterium]|nr:MAG: DUF4199 domain-containing protein [Chitinophagaceae bacterium]